MIEQTRRALADAGLIAKSRGRSFSEMSDREALYLLIAVGLPVKRDQRVEWIKSFDPSPILLISCLRQSLTLILWLCTSIRVVLSYG